jgi:hypothetical protein
MNILAKSLACAAIFCGSSVMANAGDTFTLHNDTNGWVITSFKTNETGKFGDEWLGKSAQPGAVLNMNWGAHANVGPCKVSVKLGWKDHADTMLSPPIDFCKIRELHVTDDSYFVR